MCTSLTYSTVDGHHFLARTMDFSLELDANPLFLPRHFKWYPILSQPAQITKYAIMGAGAQFSPTQYLVADGFNEHGLACAELFFAGAAVYEPNQIAGKLNLVAEEFTTWALGYHQNLADLAQDLENVVIIDSDQGELKANQPLHWIFTDKTGETMIIEPEGHGLHLINDPVGVMTNTPNLDWHLKNLNNYLNLQPMPFPERQYSHYTAHAFSQGTGTQALPGGYTPPQRFVRAAYSRQTMPQAQTAADGVNALLHMLDNVTIPKGANLESDGQTDYTQYQGVLSLDERAYYFVNYTNRTVYRTTMTDELIQQQTTPVIYPAQSQQQSVPLN